MHHSNNVQSWVNIKCVTFQQLNLLTGIITHMFQILIAIHFVQKRYGVRLLYPIACVYPITPYETQTVPHNVPCTHTHTHIHTYTHTHIHTYTHTHIHTYTHTHIHTYTHTHIHTYIHTYPSLGITSTRPTH